ncbi:outer membrane protein assembly factor BamB family protein, partial [Listeria monocytogenes]|uniref:outer membrane protein assembly factor BamB family protein n=1 Tax=Listeria monocytogenes TaxID=1639 RepID=UPI00122E19E2
YGSGRVLAVTARGKIHALEPATGRVRWTRGGEAKTKYQIFAVADRTLYTAESEKLRALDLETGKPKWATDVSSFAPFFEPFTVIKNRIFIFTVNGDAMNASTSMFSAQTGRFLGEADSYGPLAAVGGRVFFQDNWFPLDYPDDIFVNVYSMG